MADAASAVVPSLVRWASNRRSGPGRSAHFRDDHALSDHGPAEPRIALTDPWLSPLFAGADMVLPSTLTAPVPFDALTPALTLTKALIDAISDQFGTLAFDADVRRRRRE